ncbi:MAG TPA: DUF5672 family protein [Usitatibacter sp.]|nr:DUF5672 family protein [Usitatibacter sp.]
MPRIPRTTLACIDCALPRLAARAMALTLGQCEYEEVKLFTDAAPASLAGLDPRVRIVPITAIASSREYSHFVMKELAGHLATDFVQLVQWDGYVMRGEAWDDHFLDYDYIGARWWFREPGRDVGNGGFSLRSRRLLEAVRDDAEVQVAHAEDEAICRTHRALLETRHGVCFAPGPVADRYAFEATKPTGSEFGFHGIFNLPRFMDEAALAELLDAIPEAHFCAASSVSLVEWLAFVGRKREALKYAKRLRALRYRGIQESPGFLERLLKLMPVLVGRNEPCPCGSGRPYKRCCGVVDDWSAGGVARAERSN